MKKMRKVLSSGIRLSLHPGWRTLSGFAVLLCIACAGMSVSHARSARPASTLTASTLTVAAGDVAGLIAAINTANASSGPDTITLACGTYSFTTVNNFWYGPNALPEIKSDITIEGNGATLQIVGEPIRLRFFFVGADPTRTGTLGYHTPGAGNLTLRNLTLTGGRQQGGASGEGGGGAGMGGAIFNQGMLTLDRVTLTDNKATGGGSGLGNARSAGGMGAEGNSDEGFGGSPAGGFGGSVGNPGNGGGGFGPTDNSRGIDGGGVLDGLGGFGGSFLFFGSENLGICGAGSGGAGGSGKGGDFGRSGSFGGGGGGVGGGGGGGTTDGSGGGGGFGGGGGAAGAGNGGSGGFGGGGGGTTAQVPGSGGFGGGFGGRNTNGGFGGGGAGFGGAVFNHGGILAVINSTLTANEARGGGSVNSGAGNGLGGAIFNLNGDVTLNFSTFARNAVTAGAGGAGNGLAAGGAIYNLAFHNQPAPLRKAALTISNCILSDSAGGRDLVNDQPRFVGSQAFILLPNNATATLTFTDANLAESSVTLNRATTVGNPSLSGIDPQLGALSVLKNCAASACVPAVLPINTNSPAFNAASGTPPATDQTGTPRPTTGADLGAYEACLACPVITIRVRPNSPT